MCNFGNRFICPKTYCMNKLFCTLIIVLVAVSASAQNSILELKKQPPPSSKPNSITGKSLVIPELAFDSLDRLNKLNYLLQPNNAARIFSHPVLNGNVYLLSPDNMPCVVPRKGFNAPMPNAKNLLVTTAPVTDASPKPKQPSHQ